MSSSYSSTTYSNQSVVGTIVPPIVLPQVSSAYNTAAMTGKIHFLSLYVRGVPMCTQIRKCVQLDEASIGFLVTVKPIFLKNRQKTTLMTNGSLMKVESIADWNILQFFWPALSDNQS